MYYNFLTNKITSRQYLSTKPLTLEIDSKNDINEDLLMKFIKQLHDMTTVIQINIWYDYYSGVESPMYMTMEISYEYLGKKYYRRRTHTDNMAVIIELTNTSYNKLLDLFDKDNYYVACGHGLVITNKKYIESIIYWEDKSLNEIALFLESGSEFVHQHWVDRMKSQYEDRFELYKKNIKHNINIIMEYPNGFAIIENIVSYLKFNNEFDRNMISDLSEEQRLILEVL